MTMNADNIRWARAVAERFCGAADVVIDELQGDQGGAYITGTKKSGALRRASMELTRALANMRRP